LHSVPFISCAKKAQHSLYNCTNQASRALAGHERLRAAVGEATKAAPSSPVLARAAAAEPIVALAEQQTFVAVVSRSHLLLLLRDVPFQMRSRISSWVLRLQPTTFN
jgi:hypothetical protein